MSTNKVVVVVAASIFGSACIEGGMGPAETAEVQALDDSVILACEADVTSDPLNCGACGTVCNSGLCYAGVCADDRAGHVFVIGHSYRTSNGALDRVLANAAFMNEHRPGKIVTWNGPLGALTPPELVTGTNAALTRMKTVMKHDFALVRAKYSTAVQTLLPTADVFLIYAQPQVSDDYLQALGDEWRLPIDDFTRRGGIVIVLDAPSANHGTAQILTAAGLPVVGARAAAPGGVAYVAAHDDLDAARIPLTFALTADSVGYDPAGAVDVATGESGSVVVAHRTVY
jgi:hypothetical protein